MPTRRKTGPRQTTEKRLTPLQERFCYEYVIDYNATQAAIRAGYSKGTADTQGPRLLDNVGVHSLIERLRAEQRERLKMTADEVLEELAKIARSNIKRVFKDGKILSPDDMPDEVAAAVESFEARLEFADDGAPPEEIRRIKMHGKIPALRILAQHHKLIGAEVEVNLGGVELANRLAAARKRNRKGE